MKLTDQEKTSIKDLATQFPHNAEVVEDVYEVVRDFDQTRIILEFSSRLAVNVYPILRLIKDE